jgi:hypothetical protein
LESATTLTFKDDGKPYPVSGNSDFDMVSVARVDASTFQGTHASGGKYDDVSVYDRQ